MAAPQDHPFWPRTEAPHLVRVTCARSARRTPGVPLWLCALGVLALVYRNRGLRQRHGDIPVREQRAGKTRWTRSHGLWVSDVFAWRGSPAAWREELVRVVGVSVRSATPGERKKLHRLGSGPVVATMTTSHGEVVHVAGSPSAGWHWPDRSARRPCHMGSGMTVPVLRESSQPIARSHFGENMSQRLGPNGTLVLFYPCFRVCVGALEGSADPLIACVDIFRTNHLGNPGHEELFLILSLARAAAGIQTVALQAANSDPQVKARRSRTLITAKIRSLSPPCHLSRC